MKKLLLIVLIVMSCDSLSDLLFDNKEEISEAAKNIESGSYVGYTAADCVSIELQCIDLEGDYQFGEPETEIMCVCDW